MLVRNVNSEQSPTANPFLRTLASKLKAEDKLTLLRMVFHISYEDWRHFGSYSFVDNSLTLALLHKSVYALECSVPQPLS